MLVGPCAQAQGQGFDPAIRAGKGWRGRRELAPRRSATQLGACAVRSYRQRHVRYTLVRTTTTRSLLEAAIADAKELLVSQHKMLLECWESDRQEFPHSECTDHGVPCVG